MSGNYHVIAKASLEQLTMAVREFMSIGAEPIGGVSVADINGTQHFVQAVYQPKQENHPIHTDGNFLGFGADGCAVIGLPDFGSRIIEKHNLDGSIETYAEDDLYPKGAG